MAPPQTGPKKSSRRSRKARTEVSSSSEASSSDSEGSISSPEPKKASKAASKADVKRREASSPSPVEEGSLPAPAPKTDNEQAFESFYLRQSAKEFSDDLDKLRSANDFKGQSSVELLVVALKQGGNCFSKEERMRVGAGSGTGAPTAK